MRSTPARSPGKGEPFVVYCQRGRAPLALAECTRCPRLLDIRAGTAPGTATLLCRFTSEDPVSSVMTRASALLSVSPVTPLADADQLLRDAGVHHVLVVADGELVGVMCRCDLARPFADDERVASRMSCPVVDVAPRAPLGDVLSIMNTCGIGLVVVVDGEGAVLGAITRGDLRRTGVPEELLGGRRCAACGGPHGRIAEGRDDVSLCADCAERAHDDSELGGGD